VCIKSLISSVSTLVVTWFHTHDPMCLPCKGTLLEIIFWKPFYYDHYTLHCSECLQVIQNETLLRSFLVLGTQKRHMGSKWSEYGYSSNTDSICVLAKSCCTESACGKIYCHNAQSTCPVKAPVLSNKCTAVNIFYNLKVKFLVDQFFWRNWFVMTRA
jgi:hypothetical protein